MRISGVVFIIIGAIVAVTSFVLLKQGQKMILFLWAGIAMAGYGILQLVYDRPKHHKTHEQHHTQHSHLTHERTEPVHHNQIPRVCSQCGAKNNPKANYCGHCGNRL